MVGLLNYGHNFPDNQALVIFIQPCNHQAEKKTLLSNIAYHLHRYSK